MTGNDRINVLIYGTAAHIAWCTTGLAEKAFIDRNFVTDTESLAEVLRNRIPEIALIACEDPLQCGSVIAICRRANPGIAVIVVKTADAPAVPEENLARGVFAVTSHETDTVELGALLKKAVAFITQRRELQQKAESRRMRRDHPASWLLERETRERDARLSFATSLIRNILHSASQGLGIGSVLTYVDLLQMTMPALQKENDVFGSLLQNARAARTWLSSFEHILAGLQRQYPREVVHGSDFSQIVEQALRETEKFRTIKQQSIDIQHLLDVGSVYGNREALLAILSELLLNACKYSPANSCISLMSYTTAEISAITVTNDVEQGLGASAGIPADAEDRVFEPFFRLNNIMDDRYAEQKYGLGIGLTLAEHAALQCGGRLYLYELGSGETHASAPTGTGRRVVAELVLQKVQ
ncbi:MAG: sensor histidine kinase [Spirochaetota bacterium]